MVIESLSKKREKPSMETVFGVQAGRGRSDPEGSLISLHSLTHILVGM